jgi:hypothetical protein
MWGRVLAATGTYLLICLLPTAASTSTPLYLAHLAPYTGPWTGGIQMEPAVIMAFEDINADPKTLPGERCGGHYNALESVFGGGHTT